MTRYVYFDDEPTAAEDLAASLREAGFEVDVRLASGDLDLTGFDPPDGYLIDYVLNLRASYLGGTLGSAIRERNESVPLVLVTRKNNVENRSEDDLLDEFTQFDAVIFKGDLQDDPALGRDRLRALADGFIKIERATRTGEGLLAMLAPPSQADRQHLLSVGPPLLPADWQVLPVARWIERVLIRYPGVLLDPLHAASVLGLSERSFLDDRVATLFSSSRYVGPLAPAAGRWWKRTLLIIAEGMAKNESPAPLYQRLPAGLASVVPEALIEASACIDDGEPADSVCYVLRAPVRTAHSFIYFPDQRPGAMDRARVSFEALRTDNRVRLELVDPVSTEAARELQRMHG